MWHEISKFSNSRLSHCVVVLSSVTHTKIYILEFFQFSHPPDSWANKINFSIFYSELKFIVMGLKNTTNVKLRAMFSWGQFCCSSEQCAERLLARKLKILPVGNQCLEWWLMEKRGVSEKRTLLESVSWTCPHWWQFNDFNYSLSISLQFFAVLNFPRSFSLMAISCLNSHTKIFK